MLPARNSVESTNKKTQNKKKWNEKTTTTTSEQQPLGSWTSKKTYEN